MSTTTTPSADIKCLWDEDDDGTYQTEFLTAFVFIDGGFEENGFLFCPYCGRPITSHHHETGTDV